MLTAPPGDANVDSSESDSREKTHPMRSIVLLEECKDRLPNGKHGLTHSAMRTAIYIDISKEQGVRHAVGSLRHRDQWTDRAGPAHFGRIHGRPGYCQLLWYTAAGPG